MNYKKLILVGVISAFVAILTSILGVAGTVIGSVISSVLYNMLSEALEKPVATATFSTNFEWDVAYIFPLAVIGLIQLLLIFALLSEFGIMPATFLNAFLSLQHLADNNLYKILGFAMIIISVYPLVLKPDIIKKSHGAIIAFVGLIFLARGFVDYGNVITNIYDVIFAKFDLPIAVIALILIVYVIYNILVSARESEKEFKVVNHSINENNFSNENVHRVHHSQKHDDFTYEQKRRPSSRHNDFDYNQEREGIRVRNRRQVNQNEVRFSRNIDNKSQTGINKSSDKIQFESNDLLDDYKK